MSVGDAVSIASTALTIKGKKEDYDALQLELETAKTFVLQVKQLILEAAKSTTITSCSLPDLMDAVNAFQDFITVNFEGSANQNFWNLASPAFYRVELQTYLNNVHLQFTVYQMEMQVYWNIVLDHAAEGNQSLSLLQAKLQARVQECARVYTAFQQRVESADICPLCLGRNGDKKTITEDFLERQKAKKAI